jgi:hypothetical protein
MDSYFICSSCNKSIFSGETMWSINVHREVDERGGLTVLLADCIYLFCEDCAKQYDFNNISVPMKTSAVNSII